MNLQGYELFQARAEAVSAVVLPVASLAAAGQEVLRIAKELNANGVYADTQDILEKTGFRQLLADTQIPVLDQLDRQALAKTDLGFTFAPGGIAETGSLVSTDSILGRMISMLVPYHIALVRKNTIRETVPDAMEAMMKENNGLPSYFSFITGPSRTSDIERVLSIGVHGPSKLFILVVEGDH